MVDIRKFIITYTDAFCYYAACMVYYSVEVVYMSNKKRTPKKEKNRKWYVYVFEDGYRTGVCRLYLSEINTLSRIHGDLMRYYEV